MFQRRDFWIFSGIEKLKNNSEFIVYHTIDLKCVETGQMTVPSPVTDNCPS